MRDCMCMNTYTAVMQHRRQACMPWGGEEERRRRGGERRGGGEERGEKGVHVKALSTKGSGPPGSRCQGDMAQKIMNVEKFQFFQFSFLIQVQNSVASGGSLSNLRMSGCMVCGVGGV